MLNDRSRRGNVDHDSNLSHRGHRRHTKSKQNCQCGFFHGSISSKGIETIPDASRDSGLRIGTRKRVESCPRIENLSTCFFNRLFQLNQRGINDLKANGFPDLIRSEIFFRLGKARSDFAAAVAGHLICPSWACHGPVAEIGGQTALGEFKMRP
jgi:hypothetical protein